MPSALPANPLPACPGTPNCVRDSRMYSLDPEMLFRQAEAALESIGAATIERDAAGRRLDAVFRVFFFRDDVQILVAPHEGGSVLHIRSASRVGKRDLGVNRRRVQRFYTALR